MPNRDIFQDIYPESDHDTTDDESDDDDDQVSKKVGEALAAVREKLTGLCDDQTRAREFVASAESRLKILDAYSNTLDRKRGGDIDAGLDTYRTEREKLFKDQMEGKIRSRLITRELADVMEEEQRLAKIDMKKKKQADKIKASAQQVKDRESGKKQRRKAEALKEKRRIREEREKFWPRYCWSVRITLDAVSITDTPGSSRRSSVASAADLVKAPASDHSDTASYNCDLSLSYVVSSAYWSPSYDLSLSTTANTGTLCFDAQLTNKTSENWSNCKIVLSTSQATFAGLQDAIPTLVPWRLRLGARGHGKQSYILDSREERAEKEGWQSQQNAWQGEKSRSHLYGFKDSLSGGAGSIPKQTNGANQGTWDGFSGAVPQASLRQPLSGGLFGGVSNQHSTTTGLFGATASSANPTRASEVFGSRALLSQPEAVAAPPAPGVSAKAPSRGASSSLGFFQRSSSSVVAPRKLAEINDAASTAYAPTLPDEDDVETMRDEAQELSFQESSFEETGLTTTYDLPGLKTLNTGFTASKQPVARVSFSNVAFSHTVVAKYKPVAYLKAKLRNASKLTLLKGPVGLSLDGSFMGRSTLPRCSAGDDFTLSLGVDPAIDVVYPKPDVRRSTSGIFNKEDSSVYTRSVTINNTLASAGKPINLVVLDQVPVSEDERLRIFIANPRGVAVGGTPVPAGVQGKTGRDNADWGKATATLKKAGEVSWDVVLNAGRSVKLALEYELAVPGGDVVVQV